METTFCYFIQRMLTIQVALVFRSARCLEQCLSTVQAVNMRSYIAYLHACRSGWGQQILGVHGCLDGAGKAGQSSCCKHNLAGQPDQHSSCKKLRGIVFQGVSSCCCCAIKDLQKLLRTYGGVAQILTCCTYLSIDVVVFVRTNAYCSLTGHN
jgi:hypothetical protein